MKKFILLLIILSLSAVAFFAMRSNQTVTTSFTQASPDDQELDDILQDWTRPAGPAKVALQVGHWKIDEVPEELAGLKGNTGASGDGKTEWEVNYAIAQHMKELLEAKGVSVELLPATVPQQYWADVFISIHADGSQNEDKNGFKAAISRNDVTGNADELLSSVTASYKKATGLEQDPNVTRNMRGYYAFRWWRYTHAVHPMTTAVIFETGYLSSPTDREVILDNPELAARGISDGVFEYLNDQKLL